MQVCSFVFCEVGHNSVVERVIIKADDQAITAVTQQVSDLLTSVAVINHKRSLTFWRLLADSAGTVLGGQHVVVVF